uniref:Uncharacterized protein n=1 Tax=Populus trichocarpa TaxID=3694 RepID=A0A2K1YEP2_POPTR
MVEQMHLLTQMMWMKWIVQVLAKLFSQDVFLNHFHSKGFLKCVAYNFSIQQLRPSFMQRNSSLGCLFSVICHVSHSPINRWSFIAEDCRKYSSMQLASEGIEFSGGFSPETLDVRSEWMFDPKCLSTLRWCTICDFSRLQSERLFSCCPITEEQIIHDCRWENVQAICIDAPMPRELKIIDEMDSDDDGDSNYENDTNDSQHDASFCQFDTFLLPYKIILIIQKQFLPVVSNE